MNTSWLLIPTALLIPSLTHTPPPATLDDPGVQTIGNHDEHGGAALGTIVVWDNYHSGKPTAHVEGRLMDGARAFARLSARLEDDGSVTGTATCDGRTTELEGCWRFSRHDEEGRFEFEFEFGHHTEFEVRAEFEGRRSYWTGGWRIER